MSYTTDDFEESISRAGIDPHEVEAVVAAWGKGDGMGDDAGHYRWSADGASDWSGGFLMRLVNGTWAYLTGWCDYTGWGCQDGAYLYRFDHRPSRGEMEAECKKACDYSRMSMPADEEWDTEPADLNLWLTRRRRPHPSPIPGSRDE